MVTTRAQARTPSKTPSNGHASPAGTPTKSRGSNSPSGGGKALTAAQLAPKSTSYEFGGPPGALFVTLSVPFFAYLLYFGCNERVGCALLPTHPKLVFRQMGEGVLDSFKDTTAWAIYFGWYASTVLCWLVLPGKRVEGGELRTGGKLGYKMNAFSTMMVALLIAASLIITQGPESFTALYDHWPGLVTASIVNSAVQAFYVYAASFGEGRLLALGGNSGNVLYDWFIGRELNPRIGSFDIKTFNEMRPGLILWILIDISCACHQWVTLGGRVTDSMLLVCAFHAWYVLDAEWNEPAILTTMDITTDGFGFMLSVGDLTWVPFVYSLQARYLAFRPVDLGLLGTASIIAFNMLGYYIFRTANGEKNDFRNGKNPKDLTYMTTATGRKLLTSGWWGRSRHPNYMGDWLMAWAWSLPTGFATPIPYFYVAFFAVLLVHRQMRDDEACRHKYGKDWDKYCKLVPSRIIPGVY